MSKPSRLGFVKKMAAGSSPEEEAHSVGVAPTEPTKPHVPIADAVPVLASSEAPLERIAMAAAPPVLDPPPAAYGYASQTGPRPRRTNYVRIHVTMDTALANFVDVRWRTYRLQNGQLAPNASAYLQDLVARDRAAHPIKE
jgi:hypothetical protein